MSRRLQLPPSDRLQLTHEERDDLTGDLRGLVRIHDLAARDFRARTAFNENERRDDAFMEAEARRRAGACRKVMQFLEEAE